MEYKTLLKEYAENIDSAVCEVEEIFGNSPQMEKLIEETKQLTTLLQDDLFWDKMRLAHYYEELTFMGVELVNYVLEDYPEFDVTVEPEEGLSLAKKIALESELELRALQAQNSGELEQLVVLNVLKRNNLLDNWEEENG